MPKISIVMPTYNQAKFIKAAIDSILAQTFQDFELIIVNDGSTDNTKPLLESYLGDDRVRILKKENGGTGSALNRGFEYARGQYETWFSSDNIMYPTALQDLSDYLDAHPDIDYVYGNCEIGVMDHTGLVEAHRKNIKDEISQEWNPAMLQHHYFLGIIWLWRKDLRIKAGPFQLEPCEDYYMVLEMERLGGRFAFLDKTLAWFRRHGENMSMKINKEGKDYSGFVRRKSAANRKQSIIPKIAHFYWGEKTLPYMRYLTISSFARYNPEWKIKLYTPTIGSSSITWPSHEHKYKLLNVKNYYDELLQLNIEHIEIDFNQKFGVSNNMPEVHKSDYLRWHLLSTEGGLWSDMDILYFASMPKDFSNFETGICINNIYGHSVGFLLATPFNDFYKDIARLARFGYKADDYQCLGTSLLTHNYPDFKGIERKCRGVFNIPMDIVYPYDATRIQDIYALGELSGITGRTIGIHWYAGHSLAGKFQEGKISDCRLADIIKKEGYSADFDNSTGYR